MEKQNDLNSYIAQAIRDNWELRAFSDLPGATYQYKEVARLIAEIHEYYMRAGLRPGDRVAICGKNSSNWAIAFLATITYGAISVPILSDFKPDTIHYLIGHCGARIFITEHNVWQHLDHMSLTGVECVVSMDDFSILHAKGVRLIQIREKINKYFGEKYPSGYAKDDVKYYDGKFDEPAIINYTSGSMGFSKGVVLTYGNIWSNVQFSIDGLRFLTPGDGTVCILPLAHMFGLVVELLHPFVKGCYINFITKAPSPHVLLDAFAKVKPKLITAVPLILEKIIKSRVFPELEKPTMKILLNIPIVNKIILSKIKKQLLAGFGGNLRQMIIGGAALNKDVEAFLRKIKFPFTVGYGMTECGPLIAYAPWEEQRAGSCGRVVDRMSVRIDSPDNGRNVPGVIWVKGDNVMKGYYENPQATEAVFDKDGWMNTGDIGTIDSDGFIYLRGRDKNMILGPSGQNIYPEEIEQKLNNMPYVGESLVVDRDGVITALIHPDMDQMVKDGIAVNNIEAMMEDNVKAANKELPAYSQIRKTVVMSDDFERTPKRSIKRYLYQQTHR